MGEYYIRIRIQVKAQKMKSIKSSNDTLIMGEKIYMNKNAIDLKLKSDTNKLLVYLSYEVAYTLNNKVLVTCFFEKYNHSSIHRIFIERSQDGKSFYSLQMIGQQPIGAVFFYIDDTSNLYDKLWYRLRLTGSDGTQVLSKALTIAS